MKRMLNFFIVMMLLFSTGYCQEKSKIEKLQVGVNVRIYDTNSNLDSEISDHLSLLLKRKIRDNYNYEVSYSGKRIELFVIGRIRENPRDLLIATSILYRVPAISLPYFLDQVIHTGPYDNDKLAESILIYFEEHIVEVLRELAEFSIEGD